MSSKACTSIFVFCVLTFLLYPTVSFAAEPCRLKESEAEAVAEQINMQHGNAFEIDINCATGFLDAVNLKPRRDFQGPLLSKLPPNAEHALQIWGNALGMRAHAGQCSLELERVFERPSLVEAIRRIGQRHPVPMPSLIDSSTELASASYSHSLYQLRCNGLPVVGAKTMVTRYEGIGVTSLHSSIQAFTSPVNKAALTMADLERITKQGGLKTDLGYYRTPDGFHYVYKGHGIRSAFVVDAETGVIYHQQDLLVNAHSNVGRVFCPDPQRCTNVAGNSVANQPLEGLSAPDPVTGEVPLQSGLLKTYNWECPACVDPSTTAFADHTPTAGANTTFNFAEADATVRLSEVNAYYHISQIYDYFSLLGHSGFGSGRTIDDPVADPSYFIEVQVNAGGVNNAFYCPVACIDGNDDEDCVDPEDFISESNQGGWLRFYNGTASQNLAWDNSVIYHEYGHGVTDNIYGGSFLNLNGGLNESMSDWFSSSFRDRALLADFAVPARMRNLEDNLWITPIHLPATQSVYTDCEGLPCTFSWMRQPLPPLHLL